MTQSKHTPEHAPAPWNTIIQGERGAQKCRVLSSATTIADVYCCGDYNADATAHLIAAAPELLEALEKIANGYPNREIDIYAVKAAIAKARGES